MLTFQIKKVTPEGFAQLLIHLSIPHPCQGSGFTWVLTKCGEEWEQKWMKWSIPAIISLKFF